MVIDSLRGLSLPSNRNAFLGDLNQRLMRANEEILNRSAQLTRNGVMGATIVIFLCYEGQGVCLWAGDSRIYLCRAGKLHVLTRDHSQIEEMIRSGLLGREEAGQNSANHVITRAVGVQADLKVDVTTCDLQSQDVFLLCSDGLSDVVSHSEIEKVLMSETCQESAKDLIALALSKGAPDNVTVVVVHVE
jgi:protein phosphatase